MRARAKIAGIAVLAGAVAVVLPGPQAGAVVGSCPVRSSTRLGYVPWQLRQASGLTTTAESPGVLFTHNDRGLRDSPNTAQNEDTDTASVWAIRPDGTLLARINLTNGGSYIQYADTEAIGTDRRHRVVNGVALPDQIILADTGNNVDPRVTVALYRFTPPVIRPTDAFRTIDVPAEIIPVEYYNKATGGTPVTLNVESFALDRGGNGWFIPRKTGLPYAYRATAAALDAAANGTTPARAVRSTQLLVDGPMTDASISPNGTRLTVKTMEDIYVFSLSASANGSDIPTALGTWPCLAASAPNKSTAGYGEAITARDDGGFYTVPEGAKTARGTAVSPIWSLNA
jgi:hypothetical protein